MIVTNQTCLYVNLCYFRGKTKIVDKIKKSIRNDDEEEEVRKKKKEETQETQVSITFFPTILF